jgi:4-aminobutyrate aminotransferase/(S)-3-amino-2-methylpropionate transaminase
MAQDYLEQVTSKIEKEVGAHNVAAILIEPIQGEGGFIVPPKGFLPGLSKFATKNGIVFIADEVQTGFARTGQMFACEDENIEPDMIVTAKGIAGGLPLAAVTARAEIIDSSHVDSNRKHLVAQKSSLVFCQLIDCKIYVEYKMEWI